jgi:hypothetical protein
MKTIWKFPFEITDKQLIEMPAGAHIVHVGFDPNRTPCLWAEVDPGPRVPRVQRTIYVFGTGRELAFGEREVGQHLGTFNDGPFVWHIYAPAQSIFPA